MKWVPIRYRDFFDVPRIFIAAYEGARYLFDCPFDDELDYYSDHYRVYQLPVALEGELEGSCGSICRNAQSACLGRVR
jgi:hypothetical protein